MWFANASFTCEYDIYIRLFILFIHLLYVVCPSSLPCVDLCVISYFTVFHWAELCVDGCRRTNKQETVHWKIFLPLFILTKLHNAPFTQWNQSSFTFSFSESSSTHLTICLFSHNHSSLPISSIFTRLHFFPHPPSPVLMFSPCPLILPLLKLFRRTCN